jgi:hypothetical protein
LDTFLFENIPSGSPANRTPCLNMWASRQKVREVR